MNASIDLAYQRAENIAREAIAILPNVLMAGIVVILFVMAARFVKQGITRIAQRAGQPLGVANILGRIGSWVVLLLGGMIASTIVVPSLNAASIFGALGVSGIAIGFAFKDILQNLIAGLIILITRPFRIGDQIISGNHEGTIEDILVRATRLRTYDNRIVLIPNSELFVNRVTVNTANPKRRTSIAVRVAADEDLEYVKALVLDTLKGSDHIEQDPAPSIYARDISGGYVTMDIRVWTNPARRSSVVDTEDAAIMLLLKTFAEAHVRIEGVNFGAQQEPVAVEHATAPAATTGATTLPSTDKPPAPDKPAAPDHPALA